MLLRFQDCRRRFGSPYQIEKAVREGRLFKMMPGVYSESGEESEIEVLQARYPKAVLTLDSAYYYYDMTDEVPELYVLATADNALRIKEPNVRQVYVPCDALMVGAVKYDYEGETRTIDMHIKQLRHKLGPCGDMIRTVHNVGYQLEN